MYNLAHLYLYEKQFNNCIDESIKLLMELYGNFFESKPLILLSLAFIDKIGFDILKIEKEIKNIIGEKNKNIPSKICQFIKEIEYNKLYESYRNVDFLYNNSIDIINSQDLKIKEINQQQKYPITKKFREGFGID